MLPTSEFQKHFRICLAIDNISFSTYFTTTYSNLDSFYLVKEHLFKSFLKIGRVYYITWNIEINNIMYVGNTMKRRYTVDRVGKEGIKHKLRLLSARHPKINRPEVFKPVVLR